MLRSRPQELMHTFLNATDRHHYFILLNSTDRFETICELLRKRMEKELDDLIRADINISFYDRCLTPIAVAIIEGNTWGEQFLLDRIPGLKKQAYRGYYNDPRNLDHPRREI